VVATGGTPGYSYLWSDGQSTATAINLSAGPITVTVTDANGCTATRTVTVTNANAPTMSIVGTNDVTCFGDNDGWVAVSVTGGNAPYQYAWNTPQPVNNDTLLGVGGGTWVVTVTDANGCIITDSATLSEPTLLVVTPDSVAINCFGGADGSAFVTASGGTAPYFYAWSTGGASDTLSNLSAGIYDVIVTDGHGCTATASISLTDPLPVNAAFNATPAMPAQLQIPNANVTFLNMSPNASSYVWTFGDGGSSTLTDPTHSYTVVGDYCVTLVARDTAGCADTVQQCSYSVWQQELDIPNTFTPNSDGRNDVFQILGIDLFPNNHLQVFNRWGNLVYEKDKYDNTWDGTNIKNGAPLPDGAYFYIFKTGVEGQEDILGDVVIFR
jgi:gliding motility-associated-like protein